jgi:hypothetical protein
VVSSAPTHDARQPHIPFTQKTLGSVALSIETATDEVDMLSIQGDPFGTSAPMAKIKPSRLPPDASQQAAWLSPPPAVESFTSPVADVLTPSEVTIAPPPIQVIGTWQDSSNMAAFVSLQNQTLLARVGSLLMGEYEVTSITPTHLHVMQQISQKMWSLPIPKESRATTLSNNLMNP